ncbi:MAG: type I-E CRISPR-associated endonuclease Cas1 [Spirochaetales bacterium]|nr:type I-E CRISPR-associated endonuclease Cas1 [Spirochaetales bacterium]
MNRDLQELPRFDDNLSFLYFEKGRIEQDMKAVAYFYLDKRVPIPVETINLLMLGPGTTVTHEAIKRIADSRCLLAWVGESGVRFYSAGYAGTYSARNLLRQAFVYSHDIERMNVIRRLYSRRFGEELDHQTTIEQCRGREGARVRKAYQLAAQKYGVEWSGRKYDQENWGAGSVINRALSTANACLYGICHAAILTVGCSPGIGFIHTGKQLSFVYDIADLYKTEISIPIAFQEAQAPAAVSSRVREACRDAFRTSKLMKRIIPDILEVLYGDRSAGESETITTGRDVAVNV